ncbi:MAG: radical SAM protein [Myxococcota bacterium]|jgi:radical SAM superfamily enzyme YgiQ (UPF0313 family)|nr:radical SAM protein [Myxococcota bacterium]
MSQTKPRILLVSANTETAPYPAAPVGLCLLATSLSSAFEVRVFDAAFSPPESLWQLLDEFAPAAVGLSIRNIDDMAMEGGVSYVERIERELALPLRRHFKGPIVLGGAGYSLFPTALLALLRADAGLVGEAEDVGQRLFDGLLRGTDVSSLPGVVLPGRAPTPRVMRHGATLHLPEANVDRWIDFEPYRARGSYPVQTKRGCRFGCIYCSYPSIEGRGLRRRPSSEVVREIAAAKERLGDVTFEFVDSTFDDPREHAQELCEELARAKLGLRLRTMGLSPLAVDARLLDSMRRAGFTQVDCTPDSGSRTMLETLRKGFDRAVLERAAVALRGAAMPTMWFFVLGGPGETLDTLNETFEFIDRFIHPEDLVHLTLGLRIYPGTALQATAVARGLIAAEDELLRPRFYVDPGLGLEALVDLVGKRQASRPHCMRSTQTKPDPALLSEAMALRARTGTDEPMFRTLLRLRRESFTRS